MANFTVARKKLLLDGTTKTIEQKDAKTKAEALSKSYSAYANDLVDATLQGSVTIAYGVDGEILCDLAWDRTKFPLEEVTSE